MTTDVAQALPTRIGVVGCGLMGSGIAEVVARAELDVVVVEDDEAPPRPAGRASRGRWPRGRAGASSSEADHDAALDRIRVVTDIGRLADRELVVEAVIEDEAPRSRCSDRLDERGRGARCGAGLEHVVDPDHEAGHGHPPARVRSSACTSSTPCPVLPLVELVPSLLTADDTARHRRGLRRRGARQARHPLAGPGRLRRQRPADPVPAVGHPDDGVGLRHRRGHRRRAWSQGCAHPMGPLRAHRPHRPRHDDGGRRVALRGVQGAALRPAAAARRGWSTPACSAARPAAASTTTPDDPRRPLAREGPARRPRAGPTRCGSSPPPACSTATTPSINIMRRILQSQGAEVIHLGPQPLGRRGRAAPPSQEDVQGVAISSYQGGHVEYFRYLRRPPARAEGARPRPGLRRRRRRDRPRRDRASSHAYGVARIFSPAGRPAARPRGDGQHDDRRAATSTWPPAGPTDRRRRCYAGDQRALARAHHRARGRRARPPTRWPTCAPRPPAHRPRRSASPAPAARASRRSPTSWSAGSGSTRTTSCASRSSPSTRPGAAVAGRCSATASA